MKGTVSMVRIPPKNKLKIKIEGENMVKMVIKNITGEKGHPKYFEPQTLAYIEDKKRIELKGQESKETKLKQSLSHRLVLMTEDESKCKKKEDKVIKEVK